MGRTFHHEISAAGVVRLPFMSDTEHGPISPFPELNLNVHEGAVG